MTRARSLGTHWLRLMARTTSPVYALDDLRVIQYANSALANWLGIELESLIGERCDYHAPPLAPSQQAPVAGSAPVEPGDATIERSFGSPSVSACAAALCPPPDVLAGRRGSFLIEVTGADGRESRRWAELIPLDAGAGEKAGYLVCVSTAERPLEESPLADAISAEELHRRLQAARRTWWSRFHVDRLLGESPAMLRVRDQARWAAATEARVVIIGEAGTGREFLARAIHRGLNPQIPPLVIWEGSLLDADLMRRSVDALSRARAGAAGTFPAVLLRDADLLVDEAQRVLAEQWRGWRSPPRTYCTSRRSLMECARTGAFRSDLAAWLSTCEIEIPPLQQRAEDIPWLAQMFLEEFNAKGQRQLAGFSAEAMELLVGYRWPGQAAELERMVRESCQRAEGPFVQAADLPLLLRQAADATRPRRRVDEPIKLDAFLTDVEREVLRRALKVCRGNKAKAARWLGISRPRLLRRIEQLGISQE